MAVLVIVERGFVYCDLKGGEKCQIRHMHPYVSGRNPNHCQRSLLLFADRREPRRDF